ncbi:hypothetical protein HanXRQr2_Chr17g0824631 [Helianthus annuus]|uniref:Uncharacterized protein n=1 Tax=Helianthus annuus TaxID=4232 RepID=A0A9K3GWY7_HELAN|nr:hypothetical protein HanXRQr2_Chr17g0824631 [Helianthus annuus]
MDHPKDPYTNDFGPGLGNVTKEYSTLISHTFDRKWTLWRTWELGTNCG